MNKLKKILAIILSVCVVFALAGKITKMVYPIKYEEEVSNYAKKYGVDENLLYAIIKAESNFNEKAESKKDATGLMQIMEPTGEWISEKLGIIDFSKELLLDSDTNIEMGAFYISYLLDKYSGNVKCALSAYNAGHANVDSWLLNKKYSEDGKTLKVIPYPETDKYVNRVLKIEKIYKYLYK